MPLHYNAFISYKHAPADIAVAKDIQHRLEHFQVPKAIRRKTGRQKIERIFRDQEELPITSDLSREISDALEKAEYLIVICSTSTKLSTWVPREIAQFLKHHDRDHVLTVLVDGEPNDVIPLILREEISFGTNEIGELTETKRIYEPLSCDYRDMRTARKMEIPRLAAALLGCSYDELVMRARQYRMRRLAAFTTAGALLTSVAIGYLVWSNQQIRTNYRMAEENRQLAEQNYAQAEENRIRAEDNYAQATENLLKARRNLSIFLANESLNALNTENRILAAQLAIAALPGEGREDWPRTAIAEYALTCAVNAYSLNGSEMYSAVWDISMRGSILDTKVERNRSLAYAYDSYGDVLGLDLAAYRTLFRLETGMSLNGISIVHQDDRVCLAVTDAAGLTLIDGLSGETLWRFEGLPSSGETCKIHPYIENDRIFILEIDQVAALPSSEQNALIIRQLDPETGSPIFTSHPMDAEAFYTFTAALNRDGTALYFVASINETCRLFRCDFESGETAEIVYMPTFRNIFCITPLPDGRIVLYGTTEPNLGTDENLGYVILRQLHASLLCIDGETGQTEWISSFESSARNYLDAETALSLLNHTDPNGDIHPLILVLYGDTAFFYEQSNGELYTQFQMDADMVSANIYADDSGFLSALQNGNLVSYKLDSDMSVSQAMFSKDLFSAKMCFAHDDQIGFLAKTSRTRLQLYEYLHDKNVKLFENSHDYTSTMNTRLVQDRCFLLQQRTDSTVTFDLYDLEEKKLCHQLTYTFDSASVSTLGLDPTCRFLAVLQTYPGKIFLFDMQEEKLVETYNVDTLTDASLIDTCALFDNRIFMIGRSQTDGAQHIVSIQIQADGHLTAGQSVSLPVMDLSTESGSGFRVESNREQTFLKLIQSVDNTSSLFHVLLYVPDSGQWIIPDFVSESYTPLADLFASKQLAAFADKKQAVVVGYDGQVRYRIENGNRSVQALHFCTAEAAKTDEDLLLVLSRDDSYHLDRYAASDGRFLGSTSVTFYASDVSESNWIFADGELILETDGMINIIDLSEWVCTVTAQNVQAYSPGHRMLITFSEKRPKYFLRYTQDELIALGRQFLKGAELSDSEKAVYGIDP